MTTDVILEKAKELVGAWSTECEDLVNDIEDYGFSAEFFGDYIEADCWADDIDDDYYVTFWVEWNGHSYVITDVDGAMEDE